MIRTGPFRLSSGTPLAAALAALTFLFVATAGIPCRLHAAAPAPRTLRIGDSAPDFNLPGVDGKRYRLADFAEAKALCVVFTCNHCPTAQAYEERLKKLVKDYKHRGVAIVAISPNDPEAVRLNELGYTDLSDSLEEMKIRAEHKGFDFPYLYDGETQKVSLAYGPVATPHAFVFDGDRKLRYAGRIDDSEHEARVKTRDLRNALDAILGGRPVPVQTTRTFGCSIKWASKREGARKWLAASKSAPVRLESIDPEETRKLVGGASGRFRLVNVWATWCGPCVTEFPEIVKTQQMYGHRSFEVVTVSADRPEKKEEVLAFLRKQGAITKNYLFSSADRDELMDSVDKEWKGALPHTLLVSPEGKVVYRKTGEIDVLELRRTIVSQLAGGRSR